MSIGREIEMTALGGLERTLNLLLRLDPDASGRLAPLSGKLIELHIRGPELRFWLAPAADRLHLLAAPDRSPDTVISGTPLGLMRNGLSDDPRREIFSGDVSISGDTETGRLLKAMLDSFEIDWEEHLSHLVGDVIAHEVGRVARGIGRWSREGVDSLNHDVSDWLHEEARLLPQRTEVERFLAAVDVLRADVDRLGQRVTRLERHLGSPIRNGNPDAAK